MATKKFSLAALSLAFIFVACGDDNSSANTEQNISDSEDISVSVNEVSGVTQKGPFLMGSKVQMFEISNGRSLNQTGKSFNGKISNDKGEFKIKGSKLASQYVILEASGYYRNEITGKNSNSELTLLAISDVSDRNTINVNLLTHLEYERVNYLVTEHNLKVDEAKKQAQKEILDIFNIDNTNFSNSEDLNIAGASDEDGALLAISVLLQGDQSESQLSELLTKIAIDMEEDGEWNDEAKKNAIADWAAETVLSGRIATIRSNVEKWQLSSIVPNFEKHINNFWWTNYGLGTCDEKHEGEVLQNSNAQSATNGEYFICADGSWRKATDIEKDTYKWLETLKQSKDGDSKYGDVIKTNCYVYEDKVWRSGNENDCSLDLRGCTALRQDTIGKGSDKAWYICDAKSWRDATTYEKDTFGWKDSTDGAIKKGNVTDSIYVFDKTTWRATSNAEAKLGGCVSAIADSVGKVDNTYYICKSDTWIEASATEYDTYHWAAGKDGDSKWGSVNTANCYVFENNAWHSGNESDCSLGLRGCTALRQDTVGKGSDKVWHICDAKSWRDATTYEKDTFGWKDSTDGAIKKGNVTDSIYVFDKTAWRAASNVEAKLGGCVSAIADSVGKVGETYYICKSNEWVEASAIEYDTYRWIAKNDGEVRAGLVNKTIYYIYESKNKSWRNATTYEKDTYGWIKEENATVRKGNVTDTFYVYEKELFRIANPREIYIKEGCTDYNEESINVKSDTSDYVCKQGVWQIHKNILTDERDGQSYQTVRIGKQVWMSQDLNYADSSRTTNLKGASWRGYTEGLGWGKEECNYRLYYWNAAIDISSEYQEEKYNGENRKGICPDGWHLPSKEEWDSLINFVGGPTEAWFHLESFGDVDEGSRQPVDAYGFNARPSGSGNNRDAHDYYSDCETTHDLECKNKDKIEFSIYGGAYYWTSSQSEEARAIAINIPIWREFGDVNLLDSEKSSVYSVRCIKDEE